jgi:DNA-binding response OmpR family regulator
VRRAGVLLPLTAREFNVLEVLARAIGAAVSRSELIDRCWDEQSDPLSNVLDVHIASLRRKLGAPQLIHTVRGAGYLLEAAAP